MSGYYPEAYLRKRRREQGVRRVIFISVAILVIAVVGVPMWLFASRHIAALRASNDDPALAREKQELEQKQLINNATDQQWAADAASQAKGVDLAKAPALKDLEYAASFPQLSVGLDSAAAAEPGADAQLPAADAPPENQVITGDPALDGPGRQPDSNPALTDPQPDKSTTDKQQDADAKAKEEAQKREADKAAKLAAQKAREKKEADEKKKADKYKRQQAEDAKAKQNDKGDEKPGSDDKDKPLVPKTGKTLQFKVYAGSFTSRDNAETASRSLGSIGLQGTVMGEGQDYRVFVLKTEDIDAAQAMLNKLQSSGFGSAYMTRVKGN